jgi:hypothetical protein
MVDVIEVEGYDVIESVVVSIKYWLVVVATVVVGTFVAEGGTEDEDGRADVVAGGAIV